MPTMQTNLPKIICLRCAYEWYPRGAEVRICPACHSAYFDVPRKQPKKVVNA